MIATTFNVLRLTVDDTRLGDLWILDTEVSESSSPRGVCIQQRLVCLTCGLRVWTTCCRPGAGHWFQRAAVAQCHLHVVCMLPQLLMCLVRVAVPGCINRHDWWSVDNSMTRTHIYTQTLGLAPSHWQHNHETRRPTW